VGAGYDARAWRFARPGVTFYEVDHPATQAAKQQVAPPASPAVDVRFVPADLVVDDVGSALLASEFDPGEPCHVLVEGVTMYLDQDTVHALWHALGRVAAPGSTLSANFTGQGGGASSMLNALVSAAVRVRWRQSGEATLHWASRSRVEDLHEATGWRLDSIETGRELAARLEPETALSERGVSEHVFNTIATRTG
jgi:methyltransferase (TIGR00027 family)